MSNKAVHSEEVSVAIAAARWFFNLMDPPKKNLGKFPKQQIKCLLILHVNTNGGFGDKFLVADVAVVVPISDVSLDVSVQIFPSHEFLVAHVARRHLFLEMNEVNVFPEPSLSVELFAAQVAGHCIFAVVMEHVSLQLRILDEILSTDVTFVISPTCVRSDMPVQRFFSSKFIATTWASVRPLSGMNTP